MSQPSSSALGHTDSKVKSEALKLDPHELESIGDADQTIISEGSPNHQVVSFNTEGASTIEQDPYVPFPIDPEVVAIEDENNILRIRSILLGMILGGVVNAANLYLGLKTGLTFVASLFGSLLGFAVLKTLSKVVPENFPILGGPFGPKENAIVQTSATAAGGLSNIFVSAVPAMYQMGLLKDPKADYPRIAVVTLGVAYVGFFFATPLRKIFIVQMARQMGLIFPTSTATATTIQSLHIATGGQQSARGKIRVLLYSFLGAFILRVVSNFAPGILWDWHVFTWIYIWGNYNNLAIWAESWGWYIQWTPAVMGTGMMVGMNTALSIFAGSLLSWGVIGPILTRTGSASGLAIGGDSEEWKPLMTFASMNLKDPVGNPSPRYWLLWPGVLLMVAVSVVEVLCQHQIFRHSASIVVRAVGAAAYAVFKKLGRTPPRALERFARNDSSEANEFDHHTHEIKPWMWIVGLFASIVVTCASARAQWGMPIGMTIISIIIAVLFTLLAILSTGMTDMTPLTAVSKSSQLVLGGVTRNGHYDKASAETLNSIGGLVAAGVANQATDLTADFRIGFLLRTPPRAQWIAQGIGSLAAIFLAPAIFLLFAQAYPCILDVSSDSCAYSAPSATAWRAATIAATSPTLPIPRSSGIFAICLAVVGSLTTVVKYFFLVGPRQKYRNYLPNWMGFGVMMVVPQPCIGLAVLIGAIVSKAWEKFRPRSHNDYLFAVIAGMISGEGVGGIFNAILAIAGVSVETTVGCPAGMC